MQSVTKSQIVPLVADHYPLAPSPSNSEKKHQDGSTVSFIARSMSMVPVPTLDNEDNSSNIIEITDHELEEDLQPLAEDDVFHVRQIAQDIEKYINVPNKYEVDNSCGDKLYDIIETTNGITRRLFKRDQPFSMNVLNKEGKCFLQLEGDPGVGGLGAFVKMKRKTEILGKVVQANPCLACCNFSPTYNVYNAKGVKVSKIRWQTTRFKSCMLSAEFQVLPTVASAYKKQKIVASISRQSKTSCLASNDHEDTYSLKFENCRVEAADKALLIAAAIMLDFQFFEGREGCQLWKLFAYCIILVLIALVVAGVVVYLITGNANKS